MASADIGNEITIKGGIYKDVSLNHLSIVVVHYRTPELLRRCLDRLRAYAPGARLIVVDSSDYDDDSEDEGLELLRPCYPEIRFLSTPNHSFAHAVNVGLKASDTPFVAHMNADVMVGPETFPVLLGALTSSENVGMVGPRCFVPGGWWQDQGPLYRRHHLVLDRVKGGSSPPTTPVGWLSGCLQLLRREVVGRVGGLDTRLRFYNEDMEWCLRLRAAGYRCLLVDTAVLHLGGQSTPAATRFWLEGLRGGYLLSARYQPRSVRRLHRWGLELSAYLGGRFAPNPQTRSAWRRLHRRLRSGDLSASPFGPTLHDTNPDF